MRIVAFTLSVAVGLVALVAATDAVPGVGLAGASTVPFLVAIVALWAVGLFSGVVSAGSLRDPATADGRRASRVFVAVAGAVALTATLLLLVPAVVGGVPIGVATAALAAGAAYIAANALVGRYLRGRADRRRVGPFPIPPLEPDYSRRRAYSTVLVSSAVLVVGVLFALTAGRPTVDTAPSTPETVAMAVAFAAITATVLCAFPTVTLSGRVRDLSGTDAARLKRIRRDVLGGKPIDLTDEEREIAARYAPYAAQSQRWSLAQSLTLFVGLLAINEPTTDRPLQLLIWILLPVTAAIAVPLGLRAAGRADRYALAHRDEARFIAANDDGASRAADAGEAHSPR
jgi:MFS family permease